MSTSRSWLRGPRRLAAMYMLVLLVPAVAVVWLGLDAIADDRVRTEEARESDRTRVATQVAAAIAKAVTATAQQLTSSADTLRQTIDAGSAVIDWRPGLGEARGSVFEAGERAEHRTNDLHLAASSYESLTREPDRRVRAGAWLRLARVQAKAGDRDSALKSYAALADLEETSVAGLPADFVAHRARVELLAGPPRTPLADREARALLDDLLRCRWPMEESAWRFYVGKAAEWLPVGVPGPPDELIAQQARMLGWLRQEASGRDLMGPDHRTTLIAMGNQTFVVLSSRLAGRFVALVASPEYQQRAWLAPAAAAAADDRVTVAVTDDRSAVLLGQKPAVPLPATSKQLDGPLAAWTVVVTEKNPGVNDSGVIARRRALLGGLWLLIALVFGGGYVVARAVSRELAVARMQSDFVSAVSHEFRTPLTSMRQFTDLLRGPTEPSPEKRQAFYDAQSRATDRLQRLVESLLDFGRMEAGARPYVQTPISATALVRDVAENFRRDALPQGFMLQADTSTEQLQVRADRPALSLAIWNLLDNAVKYSGDQRSIAIAVDRSPQGVVISVSDAGIGIAPAEQARIFDKFVRGAASEASGAPGTGIGLAMVRHVVEGHGGQIRVTSSLGRGSTFTITLPEAGH